MVRVAAVRGGWVVCFNVGPINSDTSYAKFDLTPESRNYRLGT